ncbi:MAG TPA: hypothetical protein VMW23_05110 [Sedimentisphaerales bacterium]|nr:hypothetical protein [Sedimentisphaerales bacterium]
MKAESSAGIICRFFCALAAALFFISIAGCENGDLKLSPQQVRALRQQNAQLAVQVKQAQADNQNLQNQLRTLAGLEGGLTAETIYNLQSIKITGYTGFYDKDGDGRREKLLVYIQPIDAEGDIIKAAGAVEVGLWNLNAAAENALLGRWTVQPQELKEMWFATFITINYRLMFDVSPDIADIDTPLTVKVAFTDYLSGKVFTGQKVIEPPK